MDDDIILWIICIVGLIVFSISGTVYLAKQTTSKGDSLDTVKIFMCIGFVMMVCAVCALSPSSGGSSGGFMFLI
jgi:biotin transporter BioY